MAKQYTHQEDDEQMMVREDILAYPQGVTIPITLPTTGSYTVEDLKRELTDFALRLLHKPTSTTTTLKSLSQLDPSIQELCGICHVAENDLNGDYARELMVGDL